MSFKKTDFIKLLSAVSTHPKLVHLDLEGIKCYSRSTKDMTILHKLILKYCQNLKYLNLAPVTCTPEDAKVMFEQYKTDLPKLEEFILK